MNATTFLRALQAHLIAYTTDPADRLCLIRVARARQITGGPIHGWRI